MKVSSIQGRSSTALVISHEDHGILYTPQVMDGVPETVCCAAQATALKIGRSYFIYSNITSSTKG